MADLIAQGSKSSERWRRPLIPDTTIVLGRNGAGWNVPWDERVSRRHAELCLRGNRLHVRKLKAARNPVFIDGAEAEDFELEEGKHFVIGDTTFTFQVDQVAVNRDVPAPLEEQTFSSQYLSHVAYRNADQRLEVLSHLPEVIRGSADDRELYARLVNLLLAGVPRAGVVAMTTVDRDAAGQELIRVVHWDRRQHLGGDFQPSRHLILEAMHRRQSVLHVWNTLQGGGVSFTMTAEADWAFCTPIIDHECRSALYVAGRYTASPGMSATPTDPTDLREDVKFTELVASTLGALRESETLRRRQAAISQFFAPAVSAAMQSADPDVVLAPREADVSVMFCDLRGFTRAAEKNADDLLGLLERVSRALGVMTHHILAQGGVLGDFHGDAAMGFWGWPIAQEDAIVRACRAALAVRREFEEASRQPGHLLAGFRAGIGLASGRAVAGRIGTSDQVKVTVFGPVVNLASRLEGMTKMLHAPILLDRTTAAFVREQVPTDVARCRRLARIRPYGSDEVVEVSELLPPVAELPEMTDDNLRDYERGLDQFIAGQWSDALELLHLVPAKDRVKDFLTVFIAQHGRTPPPDWNGVVPLTSK